MALRVSPVRCRKYDEKQSKNISNSDLQQAQAILEYAEKIASLLAEVEGAKASEAQAIEEVRRVKTAIKETPKEKMGEREGQSWNDSTTLSTG